MESKEGHAWIINAFIFFLPVLLLWIIAALWVGSSLPTRFSFLTGLKTSLLADYGPDAYNQSFKSLKLAIFGDIFSDSELPGDSMNGLEIALQGLVPTATLDAHSLSWTLTPEITPTSKPLENIEPTETPIPNNTDEKNPDNSPTPIPISTSTATKVVPTATPMRDKVLPILECVQDNEDGTITAFFGYRNTNSFKVEIPIGNLNKFTPDPKDRGQPIRFEPGRSPSYPAASFQVVFDGDSIKWLLDGESITASANSEYCDPIVPEDVEDTEDPQLSGGVPDPSPGELDACSMTITVDDIRVVDPAVSSGIAWVKLKYNVEGYTTDYIYSDPLTLCSGGWTKEGGWDGCYSGFIVIKINPDWIPPDASTPFRIKLYMKARDHDGNDTYNLLGEYTMPACCGSCQ